MYSFGEAFKNGENSFPLGKGQMCVHGQFTGRGLVAGLGLGTSGAGCNNLLGIFSQAGPPEPAADEGLGPAGPSVAG